MFYFFQQIYTFLLAILKKNTLEAKTHNSISVYIYIYIYIQHIDSAQCERMVCKILHLSSSVKAVVLQLTCMSDKLTTSTAIWKIILTMSHNWDGTISRSISLKWNRVPIWSSLSVLHYFAYVWYSKEFIKHSTLNK